MLKIKVGQMPGKLVEVVAENGTTARELFRLADVEVSNHEIRLDGNKVDIDTQIQEGNLLVAMRMIKGNATLKVGQMPGKLTEIIVEEGLTAREAFGRVNVEIANHEIRLDGNKIDLDTVVSGGNLLVAMRMIKGNSEALVSTQAYVSQLSVGEIESITGCVMPQTIQKHDVMEIDNETILLMDFILDKEIFDSIYTLQDINVQIGDVADATEITMTCSEIQENNETTCNHKDEHVCKCNKGKAYILTQIEDLNKSAEFYWRAYQEAQIKLNLLKDVLDNM